MELLDEFLKGKGVVGLGGILTLSGNQLIGYDFPLGNPNIYISVST